MKEVKMKKDQLCIEVKAHLLDIVEQKSENLPHRDTLWSHILSCPRCLHLVQEFSKLWNQLECPQELEPSSSFFNRIYQKIEDYEETKSISRKVLTNLRPALKVVPAASLVLLGILFGIFLGNTPSETKKDSPYEFVSEYFNKLEDIPTRSVADAYLYLDTGERGD